MVCSILVISKTALHRMLFFLELIQEKRVREIVLKAMGQAISKAVAIAEILKVCFLYNMRASECKYFMIDKPCVSPKQKRISRLHQETAISSVSITDVWEPIEEGLVP